MNIYKVYVTLRGHYYYEDPKCPSYWRGSGVYDIKVKAEQEGELEVCAESLEKAKEMAEDYDYASNHAIEIEVDDVFIDGIEEGDKVDGDPEVCNVSLSESYRV